MRGGFTGVGWKPETVETEKTAETEETDVANIADAADVDTATGFHGKQLSQASVNTWTSRVKTLQSLGVDFNSYNDIVGTIESQWSNINTRRNYLDAALRQLYLLKSDIELAKKIQKVRDEYFDSYRCEPFIRDVKPLVYAWAGVAERLVRLPSISVCRPPMHWKGV